MWLQTKRRGKLLKGRKIPLCINCSFHVTSMFGPCGIRCYYFPQHFKNPFKFSSTHMSHCQDFPDCWNCHFCDCNSWTEFWVKVEQEWAENFKQEELYDPNPCGGDSSHCDGDCDNCSFSEDNYPDPAIDDEDCEV